MKIAHVIQTSLDYGCGGIATYLRNIVQLQLQKGHEVCVVTNKKYKQLNKYSHPMNDFNFFKDKKYEALSHSFNVNFQLMFSNFDIIHYHFTTSAFFSSMQSLTEKKRILTIHGRTQVARNLKPITKSVLNHIDKTVIPKMDYITTVTPFLKKFIEEKYGIQSTYLPHGFKSFKFKKADIIKNKHNLTKDSYFLALSRITTNKGLDTIIESYKNSSLKSRPFC